MRIALFINDEYMNINLRPGTFNLSDSVSDRSMVGFTLFQQNGSLDVDRAQPFKVYEFMPNSTWYDWGSVVGDTHYNMNYGSLTGTIVLNRDYGDLTGELLGALITAGTIESVDRSLDLSKKIVEYTVMGVDHHKVADRRLLASSWSVTTLKALVEDIFMMIFQPEGFTIGTIKGADIPVERYVSSYQYVSAVLNDLGEKSGYIWYIDPDKTFYFVPRADKTAPWGLTENSPVKNIRLYDHRENYRNKQYILDGKIETDEITESFKAEGETRTFSVSYAISQAPTITLNTITQVVGVRGLDQDMDFYWEYGTNTITADETPDEDDVIAVTYKGLMDVVSTATNDTEIAERAAQEGGTGIYEAYDTIDIVTTLENLNDLSQEKINELSKFGSKVTFNTREHGLYPGQLLNINLDILDFESDLLITNVEITEDTMPNEFMYTITAVTGEAVGGWSSFFRKWLKVPKNISIVGTDQNITKSIKHTKNWGSDDRPNPFYKLYPSNDLYPSAELYPCFSDGKEITHIELYPVSSERFYRVKQTISEDRIITIWNIPREKCNGDIESIKVYGGIRAKTPSAGVLLESKAEVFTKTDADVLQITRVDNKWGE